MGGVLVGVLGGVLRGVLGVLGWELGGCLGGGLFDKGCRWTRGTSPDRPFQIVSTSDLSLILKEEKRPNPVTVAIIPPIIPLQRVKTKLPEIIFGSYADEMGL